MSIAELETFFDQSLQGLIRGNVTVGRYVYEYRQWEGEQLASRLVAIDSETEVTAAGKIPRLAVVQAFDGEICYLVHPDDLGRFIKTHAKSRWVGHNLAGFDFLVIYEHLRGCLGIYVICASRFSFSYWRVGGLVSLRSMRLLIAIWISAVLLSIVASYSLLNRR